MIAWDTETGRVSITAAPSCVAVGCLSPSAIGEGNNLEIQEADGGDLAFEFSAKSSARVLPAIDQTVRLHISGDGSTGVRLRGDGYPDFEAIAYRGNDAEFLASTVRGTPGGPLVQLAPPLPDRDLAWIDGNLRFQDGRPTWNDRIGPAMRQLCLGQPDRSGLLRVAFQPGTGGGRLLSARSGRAGLAWWLGLHAVLYLLLFSVAVVVSFVADGLAAEAGTGLVVSLVFALPVTIAPTVALTAIGWVIRSLPTVAFKAVVTVLVCLPLVCTSEPQQLGLLAPVQLAYGLLVRRPEWVNLVDRPDQG